MFSPSKSFSSPPKKDINFYPKMKREGRPHGMVRTSGILPSPPTTKFINTLDSPPTAGLFTKVQSKPTNHSKFTGKCGRPRCSECHLSPCCKSKDKTKGKQKLRSCDVVSSSRLITWRVVDGRSGLNFTGFSATGMLDHLGSDYVGDEEDDGHDNHSDLIQDQVGDADNYCQDDHDDCNNDDEDGVMGFCDVGLLLDQVEGDEEGWLLVRET